MLVPIRCAGRDAVAVIDQIRAVSKQRLRDRVGEVSAPELAALEEALREVLDLG
jgi:mRNA-degrading endonuclease toxin of MazEF toxin-antitoxin module